MDSFMAGDTLRERYAVMLETGDYSDITIKLKYKENEQENEFSIRCHKILLVMASAYFKECIETSSDSIIVIEESNVKLFNVIIKFVYTHYVDLSMFETQEIISLIMLSSKYKLPKLMEFCSKTVGNYICCNQHLINYFNLAVSLHIKSLQETCLRIIKQHAGSLFRHKSFMSLSPEALEIIVQEDDLNISEMELFLTILKWAEDKCPECDENPSNEDITSHINAINFPFYLQSIENKLLSILKVEQIDSNIAGIPQLQMIYNNASSCNPHLRTLVDTKPEEYWIKIRQILDQYKITKNIRFLALDPLEFPCKISSRNILTTEELSDILVLLNSSDGTLTPPLELNNNRKPRSVYPSGTICYSNVKIRIHARLLFEFLHTHIFKNESDNKFSEEFSIVSAYPVLLMAIILPPKERKGKGARYLEDVMIQFSKKSSVGEKCQRFACAAFQGRRKYGENISLMINYNTQDNSDAILYKGEEFVVEIFSISEGAYFGGLTRTSLNNENPFIVTKDKIQKGIIAGFGFCFDMGV